MPYVTVYKHPKEHELTWDEVFNNIVSRDRTMDDSDRSGTITRLVKSFSGALNFREIISAFQNFNEKYASIDDVTKLYQSFQIPKKTGGFRQIDAPTGTLKMAQRELAEILAKDCHLLYHTAAFAYVPGRNIVAACRCHARAQSNWFLKTDLSGFFPSTTPEFVMRMLNQIYPMSEILKLPEGKEAVEKALSIGFLNGSLPQGSPLSPMLTNIIMIPIDHAIMNYCYKHCLIYTRYADDMHISGKEKFPYRRVISDLENIFRQFGAPYRIKPEKTHFGSVRGKNWMLGLMLNGQYNVTVGYRNKKTFRAKCANFILDEQSGKPWNKEKTNRLMGLVAYYKMVEESYFSELINRMNKKWNIDFMVMLRRKDFELDDDFVWRLLENRNFPW